ncbi:MAG TPA: hypothetical protein VFN18_03690 [Solirubrobacterales bacterium]|nr:hypothetical protein [Solirubrobacterales bacterium]
MEEAELRKAVEHSGYPLQTVVAGALADREYAVDEEWGWVDPDQDTERTLDIVAEWSSGYRHRSEQGEVVPIRSLLIECKQSRNPYLGFSAVSPPSLDRHPVVVGLNRPKITLFTENGDLITSMSLIELLGLRGHHYLRAPVVVSSLSKAHPQGKRVEISGDEPFNSLIRPLTKASRRYREHWFNPPAGNRNVHPVRLVFPVAVIDAPLIAVHGRQGRSDLKPVPWMRVISRHAAGPGRQARTKLGVEVVDLVAADYFENFLADQLDPFFDDFFYELTRIQDVVLTGRGRVGGYEPGSPLPWDFREHLTAP